MIIYNRRIEDASEDYDKANKNLYFKWRFQLQYRTSVLLKARFPQDSFQRLPGHNKQFETFDL